MEQDTVIRLDEINIRIVIKDLLRNIIFILMAAAAGALVMGSVMDLRYKPEYTSSATLAVMARGGSGNSYSNLSTASSMADVLSAVFQSSIMKTEIVKVAGEEAEKARISASLISETNLIVLEVTSDNPEMTYSVIQTVLENYHSVSDYVFSNAVIEVIANPSIPMWPSNIVNTKKYKMEGAAAGGLAAAMLFILCTLFRRTVKCVNESNRKVEGKCIGIVGHGIKNRTLRTRLRNVNKGLLITNPMTGFGFVEEFHQLAVQVNYQMSKNGQKVLLVNSVAENEGKTTVAANLALALAKRNKKVVLMDLDLRKPAQYKLFDLYEFEEDGLLDYLNGKPKDKNLFRQDEKNHLLQVLNKEAVENSVGLIENGRLEKLLKDSRELVDFVILDASPFSVGTDAQRINELCDASLLVVRQDMVQIPDINDAIEMLQEGKSEFLGYILNDFDHRPGGGYGYGYCYGRYGHYKNYDKSKMSNTKNR